MARAAKSLSSAEVTGKIQTKKAAQSDLPKKVFHIPHGASSQQEPAAVSKAEGHIHSAESAIL